MQALLKIVNVFMQVQNNPKALISKNQQKMSSHTKQAMYKIVFVGVGKNGVLEGLKWRNLIYILTWIWSPYNQVLGSFLRGPSTVSKAHTPTESRDYSRASVTHLLRQLMGVEDAGHRHLQLVFLLLGLPQRCFPFLEEQVARVLARKLLRKTRA